MFISYKNTKNNNIIQITKAIFTMFYLNPNAQKIYDALLEYLNSPTESSYAFYTETLSNVDEQSLLDISIYETSHLIDIFNHSSTMSLNESNAISGTHDLFHALMQRCKTIPSTKAFLLLSPNQLNYTPLHQILLYGNHHLERIYLNEVRQAVSEKVITAKDLRNLLIGQTFSGQTPLYFALMSGGPEIFQAYLDEVTYAVDQYFISTEDQRNLFLAPDLMGLTPLAHLLISGTPDMILAYFKAIRQAITKGNIDMIDYQNILLNENIAGCTPLHTALISGNPENIRLYFAEIRLTINEGSMPFIHYRNLLVNSNQSGLNPLHTALISGRSDNLCIYFDELQQSHQQGILSNADYHQLLLGENLEGFSTLDFALMSRNINTTRTYMDGIKYAINLNIIKAKDYYDLLIRKKFAGLSPLSQIINQGDLEMAQLFLEELIRVHSKKSIDTYLITELSSPPTIHTKDTDRVRAYLMQKYKELISSRSSPQENGQIEGECSPKGVYHSSKSRFFGSSKNKPDQSHTYEEPHFCP